MLVEKLEPDSVGFDALPDEGVVEDSVVEIWRMRVRACSDMLKVEVCVIRKSVSMCFWNLKITRVNATRMT